MAEVFEEETEEALLDRGAYFPIKSLRLHLL